MSVAIDQTLKLFTTFSPVPHEVILYIDAKVNSLHTWITLFQWPPFNQTPSSSTQGLLCSESCLSPSLCHLSSPKVPVPPSLSRLTLSLYFEIFEIEFILFTSRSLEISTCLAHTRYLFNKCHLWRNCSIFYFFLSSDSSILIIPIFPSQLSYPLQEAFPNFLTIQA